MADMDSASTEPIVGRDDDLADRNERQEEITAIREWSDAVEANYFAYGPSVNQQRAIKVLLEELDRVAE